MLDLTHFLPSLQRTCTPPQREMPGGFDPMGVPRLVALAEDRGIWMALFEDVGGTCITCVVYVVDAMLPEDLLTFQISLESSTYAWIGLAFAFFFSGVSSRLIWRLSDGYWLGKVKHYRPTTTRRGAGES
ncbi:hypothetical protein K440DRAFT_108906 [Wilcoxina mikolae CBS 423.85]|nr:hypothetical protein K440DRAFT_108906 [Wilcoxina mikolae CBS 423.85]